MMSWREAVVRALLAFMCLVSVLVPSLVAGAEPPKDPVSRLRADAHAVRREHVELLLQRAPAGECDFVMAAAVVRRLADEADAEGDHAAAVRWHERWAAAVRKYDDKLSAVTFGIGAFGKELRRARAARVEAEIALLRRRGENASAALLDLLRQRAALCIEAEKLAGTVATMGGGTDLNGTYLEAKAARLDAEAELAAAEVAAKKGDK